MGKLFTLPLFSYSIRLIRTGKVEKEGEKAIIGEILSSEKGKTLTGIINFHPMVTDHVEPPLLKHPSE